MCTTYAELAGSNDSFTFNCVQFHQDTSGVTTVWTLENFEGFSGRTFITDILHPEFVINGTERDQLLPFPTFCNTLRIVYYTQWLHNVTLFCDQGDNLTGWIMEPPTLQQSRSTWSALSLCSRALWKFFLNYMYKIN